MVTEAAELFAEASAALDALLHLLFPALSVAQALSQLSEKLLGIAQVGCVKTFSELIIH